MDRAFPLSKMYPKSYTGFARSEECAEDVDGKQALVGNIRHPREAKGRPAIRTV
jgi:hypothetical protein